MTDVLTRMWAGVVCAVADLGARVVIGTNDLTVLASAAS